MRIRDAGALWLAGLLGCSTRGGMPPPVALARPASVAVEGAAASPLFAYSTVRVGEGIYAFVPPEPASGVVSGNSTVVIGDDAVLVVDTGRFPSLARKMIQDIRRLTDKPVRTIVTTHWHPDHNLGNDEYARAFPGVTILAHAETKRLVLKNLPKQVEIQRHSEETLRELKEATRRGRHRDGKPFTDDERAYLAATVPALEATLADARELALVPPTMTFEGESVTVFLGKREVKILHLGRGNTAGDTVVYVPDAKVLATGDLVVSPSPYPEWCYPAEWIASLDKLMAMDAAAVVPGHGPVEYDFSYVRTERDALVALRSQIRAAAAQGLTLEQAIAALDLEEFRRRMAGDDPARNRGFKLEFVETAADRAYQEAKGTWAVE
jgi:cyclase